MNKMIKKIFGIALVVAMIMAMLAGCGAEPTEKADGGNQTEKPEVTQTPGKPGETSKPTEGGHKHTVVVDVAIEPTCKNIGKTEGSHCSECGEIITAQEAIYTRSDHIYGDDGKCTMCGCTWTKDMEYKLLDDGTYALKSMGWATDKNIIIPSTYEGKPVTVISDNVFKSSDITSVHIPKSVTSIGENAFYHTKLKELVIISDEIKHIGKNAFYNAPIEDITIYGDVINIGENAFEGNRRLESLKIYGTVENIGDRAFANCGDTIDAMFDGEYTTISPLKGVKRIGKYAFSSSAFGEVTIYGDSLIIEDSIFYYAKLKSADLLGNVVEIGDSAFYYCDNMKNVTLSDGLKKIGAGAFVCCDELEELKIPDSVTSVGADICGYSNRSGSFVQVRNGIKYVGKWIVGVEDNKNMEIMDGTVGLAAGSLYFEYGDITLPNSIKFICAKALGGAGVVSINYEGTLEEWNRIEKTDDWAADLLGYTIHCTDGDITK